VPGLLIRKRHSVSRLDVLIQRLRASLFGFAR
jgi:hypothetical protein